MANTEVTTWREVWQAVGSADGSKFQRFAQSVTLTNSGNAALTINGISVTGTNSADFGQTNTCPTGPSTLAAGSSCSISVTFTPGAAGSRSASLSISDNATGSVRTVP